MRHGSTVVLVILGVGLGLAARSAYPVEPLDDRIGRRIAPIFLLARADVQSDLKLAPDQIADAGRLSAELYKKAQLCKGKREPAVIEARRRIDEAENEWLNTRLSARQLERLGQLHLQWEGAAAMISRPMVTEYLNLTPDQKQKLAELVSESRQSQAHGRWSAADHFNLTRRAITLLSDKQKDQWIHLLGPPCAFTITAQPPGVAVEGPKLSVAGSPRPTR